MNIFQNSTQVYLALGCTDMRKSINTLSIVVQEAMQLNPLSGDMFVFCNKNHSIIKILYWDKNGFCLWQKRLEKGRYFWPKKESDIYQTNFTHLRWLLDGLDINAVKGHMPLNYKIIY
jgi:transposase